MLTKRRVLCKKNDEKGEGEGVEESEGEKEEEVRILTVNKGKGPSLFAPHRHGESLVYHPMFTPSFPCELACLFTSLLFVCFAWDKRNWREDNCYGVDPREAIHTFRPEATQEISYDAPVR